MKILLPTDGSVYSRSAVDFVVSRTSLLGKNPDIVLLTVSPKQSAVRRLLSGDAEGRYYEEVARKALAPAKKILDGEGIRYTERKEVGDPAEVIAQVVEDEAPDLLIMGSRGLSAFAGLILGSVTTGVLARTTTPMLLLRGKEEPREDAMRVGIAIDGSEYGVAAARYMVDNIDLFGKGAHIYAMNVVSTLDKEYYSVVAAVADEQLSKADMKALQKEDFDDSMESVRPIFREAGIEVEEVILSGDPADEIADFAEEKRLDLVVMGSHGYTNFRSAVMGSVATHVAAQGNVPLLIVRSPEHHPQEFGEE